MNEKLILALDQGTTSSRAILFNKSGEIKFVSQKSFEQIFPTPGWVEHDPNEIWSSQISVAAEVIAKAGISGLEVAAIGITNQRETTVVWDRHTSEPIYNAIVWQDRRTSKYCDELKSQGHTDEIKQKTGLVLDAYFSATKLKWILDNVEGAREKAEAGDLCFGTVDTWLIWKLTRGKMFITDVSNASRTMMFNIRTMDWDDDLLKLFNIPRAILPEVKQSSEVYGETSTTLFSTKIPIAGVAGDQQAALFGQMCTKPGMVKNTYGTGCFLLMNTGNEAVYSKNNLLTTVAWKINGEVSYALEGSVFVGGAAIQWLRDGLKIIHDSSEVSTLAETVEDNGGVYFVPALTGLGAPYWDQYARGTIIGVTRGTTDGHIARATLEGIAFQVYDIVKAMEADAETQSTELRVDGGASASNLLMQIQSDLFGFKIIRPKTLETTALGAAYLAGLAVGFWESIDEIQSQWIIEKEFTPKEDKTKIDNMVSFWHKAVKRSQAWIED
ncbi:glycerol kinase GlpK [Elizabethkingia anophelis]|uniref:glycerol kinase GlpK n=1 Tax=Elizabethkingia anophelis TaxID=1117645 RepID=UPI000C9B99A0|nr:glycerol kinase GlpK [Elizabethkingia anophelis]MCT3759069.1 glycerol kinase GlpK [Elizabethkingia anophelis]MCT3972234.1 glycerol kinase GlpK [Elizabethkingia anophelis]MCT4000710.1 glycerol kinase GlpK [Elizabethkingia anophelis]MCT4014309.1 glycerol kinase GlpK [Elizabethkingia anophelis]MCT4017870.1 glycerol kinase GlpK [Elizabethkingia anophelis]